jgi:hypothetical protein
MRNGLFASIICLASLTAASSAFAGGLQLGQRPAPGFVAQQKLSMQPAQRQNLDQRRFAGRSFISPFGAPSFVGGSGVTVVNQAQPAETVSTVNINTNQTVVGIRRPPEAAPLLFILPSSQREARQAQRASAAIRSLGQADTTTARIIVVR